MIPCPEGRPSGQAPACAHCWVLLLPPPRTSLQSCKPRLHPGSGRACGHLRPAPRHPPWQRRLLCRDLQRLGRGSGRRRPSGPRGASRVAGCVSGEAWPAADHRSPSVCPRLGPGVGGFWVALSVPSAPAGVHAHTHACTHTHSRLPPSPVSASSGWPEAGPRAAFTVTLGDQRAVLWWQDSHLADAAAGCGRH